MEDKEKPFPELSDAACLAQFAFSVDVKRHINLLNTILQGHNAVVSQLYSHIKDFGNKLQLFQRQLFQMQPNTTHFPSLQEIMTSLPERSFNWQMHRYDADITSLADEFQRRFHDLITIEKINMVVFVKSSYFSVDFDNTAAICSGNSLSCKLMLNVAADNFFSLTFRVSFMVKERLKGIRTFVLKKCLACLARHTCVSRHFQL